MRTSVRRAFAMTVLASMAAAWLLGCSPGGGPSPATSPPDPTVATTSTGMVRGLVTPEHRLFANIPYAAPPVGPLRWQLPTPPTAWPGVRDATKFGPRCLQDDSDLELGRQTSEDCLTLNVWTPPVPKAPDENAKGPVMVWIHGGSFVNGSGGLYDSGWLASRGVVVVTVNYRLGALGFLAHPAFGPQGAAGNYGLADQQAALRWVHDNVAGFGGDPTRVTVAGESAGGMSVCDHLVAPGSAGLFRAAIIQSGPCQAQLALPDAERISLDYARDAGCGNPATAARCLRDLPSEELRKPVWYYRIGADALSGPVTGGAVLPVDPVQAFAAGGAARVPVLIGTNHDEFTLFAALQYLNHGQRYPAEEYPGLLTGTFGADAGAVAEHYPLARYGGSSALAYSAAVTDGVFACLADRVSGQLAAAGNDVYAYEFNDPSPPMPEPFLSLPFPVGASHSLELRYLFDVGGAPPLDPSRLVLSHEMLDYWATFVATGKPHADGHPDWPQFESTSGRTRMSLQPNGSEVTTNFGDAHQCPFWAGLSG